MIEVSHLSQRLFYNWPSIILQGSKKSTSFKEPFEERKDHYRSYGSSSIFTKWTYHIQMWGLQFHIYHEEVASKSTQAQRYLNWSQNVQKEETVNLTFNEKNTIEPTDTIWSDDVITIWSQLYVPYPSTKLCPILWVT